MHFIAKRLLTTIFSVGIFALVASFAPGQPAPPPPAFTSAPMSALIQQLRAAYNASGTPAIIPR